MTSTQYSKGERISSTGLHFFRLVVKENLNIFMETVWGLHHGKTLNLNTP